MKKLILAGLTIVAIGSGIFFLNNQTQPTTNQQVLKANGEASSSGTILYYGDTCPHCKDVEKFLLDNPIIGQKVQIDQKEVNQNRDNAEALVEAAATCGLDTNSIGVPFLVESGKCFMGKDEVINQLKVAAGLSQ